MLYLVTTLRKPSFDPAVIEPHYAFLDGLKAEGRLRLWGPFTDRSGGAYVLEAESLAEAQATAFRDPVHTSGASDVTVLEWNASQA